MCLSLERKSLRNRHRGPQLPIGVFKYIDDGLQIEKINMENAVRFDKGGKITGSSMRFQAKMCTAMWYGKQ